MSEQTSDITVQIPLEQLTELIARTQQVQRPATSQTIQLSPDVLANLLAQAPAPGPVVIPTTGPGEQHKRRPSGCGPFTLFLVVVVCVFVIFGLGYLRRNLTIRALPDATPAASAGVTTSQINPPQETGTSQPMILPSVMPTPLAVSPIIETATPAMKPDRPDGTPGDLAPAQVIKIEPTQDSGLRLPTHFNRRPIFDSVAKGKKK